MIENMKFERLTHSIVWMNISTKLNNFSYVLRCELQYYFVNAWRSINARAHTHTHDIFSFSVHDTSRKINTYDIFLTKVICCFIFEDHCTEYVWMLVTRGHTYPVKKSKYFISTKWPCDISRRAPSFLKEVNADTLLKRRDWRRLQLDSLTVTNFFQQIWYTVMKKM